MEKPSIQGLLQLGDYLLTFRNAFSLVVECVVVAITIPVSSASAERCFSAVKRIMTRLRSSIRQGLKLALRYRDEQDRETERKVWPVAIGFHEGVRLIAAWCELRSDFRHFRTDRVFEADFHEERYPARRDILRSQWRKSMEAERHRWAAAVQAATSGRSIANDAA